MPTHPLWQRLQLEVIVAGPTPVGVRGEEGQALRDQRVVDVDVTIRGGVTQTDRHPILLGGGGKEDG